MNFVLYCPNEFGLYDGKIYLEFPDFMLSEHGGFYDTKRGDLIDICLVEEIKFLWKCGISTYGSCCGHGLNDGMINVGENDVNKMFSLGYELTKLKDGLYPHTFIPKSKHRNSYEIK